ncbi:MAG TPA: hypothetical protein VM509_02875 [Planctomycetota bacterium]|nr:hypothetical protein [Planctomycetota bacterium]
MLRPEHELFQKPFPVAPAVERTPTPDNFKKWKPTVGDTVPTFLVFESYDEKKDEPGLVTSDLGFEDVPDAERILGGINMKGPDYAAVARHGSFVMWGFHTLPAELTDTGRKLYLNTLAYATAHRGAWVESLRLRPARTDLEAALGIFLGLYPEAERKGMLKRHFAGEEIPDALLTDRAAGRAWYAERAPFLHPADDGSDWSTAFQLAVDAQCKELGLANDSLAFLDALAARLAKDPHDALASALVARYVPGVAQGDFGAWLAQERTKLYFTETGGWIWRVRGTRVKSPVLRNTSELVEDDPVRVKAEASETTLVVTLRIRDGWHVSSPKATEGQPVVVALAEGSAFVVDGEARFADEEEGGVLRDPAEIKIPIRRVARGDALLVDVTYTACDAKSCRPPRTVRLTR